MKTIINTENIQTFIQQIPTITNNLQNISQTMKGFVDCLKQNKLTPTTQETYQEEYERKEGILKKEGELDKLEMTMKKRDEVTNKSKETIGMLKEIISTIEKITKEGEHNEETLKKAHNELIDEIIEARRKEMEEKIKEKKKEIKEIKDDFERRKEEFDKNRKEDENEKNERLEKEYENEEKMIKEKYERKMKVFEEKWEKVGFVSIPKELEGIIDKEEVIQLNKWTNKKCSEVIFDSDKDNWNQNTSVFDSKVMNKSNLMFIVEDTTNNKFGGYVNATIDKYSGNYIDDPNSFLFSLKSNGRVNGMHKFEIQSSYAQYACRLYEKSDSYLFTLGNGYSIIVYKQNSKSSSYCCQYNERYDYHGTSEAFLPNCKNGNGDIHFTPKRITVIQMK